MDLLSNFVCSVKNACANNKEDVTIQASKVLLAISSVLKDQGLIDSIRVIRRPNNKLFLQVRPTYKDFDFPCFKEFKRVSKPGFRRYWSVKQIKKEKLLTYGTYIMSTSQGVMTDKQAMEKGLGGEVLCRFVKQ